MDETPKPKSKKSVIIPPLGRRLESNLIARFWHFPFDSIIVGHQRVFWEVSGTFIISFLLNVYTFVCAFLGKQSNWRARWTVLSELRSGCYYCCFFFIKNWTDRIHDWLRHYRTRTCVWLWASCPPHFSWHQWLEMHISEAHFQVSSRSWVTRARAGGVDAGKSL